jgi:hypothetical protein
MSTLQFSWWQVEFSSDELDVFELEFQRHGVTACQFKKLMRYAEAEWRDLPADQPVGQLFILSNTSRSPVVPVSTLGVKTLYSSTDILSDLTAASPHSSCVNLRKLGKHTVSFLFLRVLFTPLHGFDFPLLCLASPWLQHVRS